MDLREEDPRSADHLRAISFLYSVYIQRVALVLSARIFLADR